MYATIQELYKTHLGRPMDLDGYERYASAIETGELSIEDVRHILATCDEAMLAEDRKRMQRDVHDDAVRIVQSFVPPVPDTTAERFHVVIARYNESVEWIHALAKCHCTVFVYNKGKPIVDVFPSNVQIIPIKNIGFEEYAYIVHLICRRKQLRVVFLQCGIDHCPHILHKIHSDSEPVFTSYYESIGQSNAWSIEKDRRTRNIIPVVRNMCDIGGGKAYVDMFKDALDIHTDDLYAYYCEKFHITPMANPMFGPCAVFSVSDATRVSLHTLYAIQLHVYEVHMLGNPFWSKVLASIIERLWLTIFMTYEM